jgi:hypothetical protein
VSLFVAFFGLAAAGTAVSIGVLMLLAAAISVAITVATRRAWPLAIAALDVVAALVFDLAEPTDKVFDMALGYVGLLLALGVALVATAGVLRSFGQARFALPLESVGAPLALIALAPLLAEHPVNGDIPETGPDTPATVLVLLAVVVAGAALVVAIRRGGRLRLPLTALAAAGLALTLAPLTLRYAYPHPLRVATTFRAAAVAAAIAGTWLWIAGRRISPRPIRRSTLLLVIATAELLAAVVLTRRETRSERASQTVRFQVAPIPPAALHGAYLPLTFVDQAVDRGTAGDVEVGDEVQVVLERSGRLLWEPTRLTGIDDFGAVRIQAVVTGVGDQVTVRFPDIDRAPLPTRPADGAPPPVAVIDVTGDATARIVHLEVARRPGRGWPQAAPTGTAASVNPSYPAAATVSQVPR